MEIKVPKFSIEDKILYIFGDLTKLTITNLLKDLKPKLKETEISLINLEKMRNLDSSGVAALNVIKEKIENKIEFKFSSKDHKNTYNTFSLKKEKKSQTPHSKENFISRLGLNYLKKMQIGFSGLLLTADIFYYSIADIFNKKKRRKGSTVNQSLLIGANAFPIISLLSLIIGLILALQSAAQLRQFGANIFVADLIAISMVREMGPMMTAIIMAGRTGSSIASEIATMKVTEEIDALKIMALNPTRYIVVPKFYAMTICMPILVAISIIVGIFGGMLIGVFYLDLTPTSFFLEALSILSPRDFVISFSKSIFFSWLIVIIGSFFGFNVTGGAEGVGKATTKAVVASIFAVIVADAIFSLTFLAG